MSKLATLINGAVRGTLDSVFVALPGKVTAYNATTQRADVQPLIQKGYRGEDQKRAVKRLPVANDVPVMFLGSAEGRTTYPVKKGTRVLLIVCSSSIARWKSIDDEVDPGDDRRHSLADAIAIVGLYARPPTSAPVNAIVLHAGTGITVKIGGDTGTQKTLMADSFLTALDTLVASISSAVGLISGGSAAATAITTALNVFKLTATRTAYKTAKTEVK